MTSPHTCQNCNLSFFVCAPS